MNATFANSALPSGSAIAWSDAESLVVELPCRDGPPYLTRYPKTPEGLRKALNVLLENPAPRTIIAPSHPAVRRQDTATGAQRAAAAEIVRRMIK